MTYTDSRPLHQHPDHIEPITLPRAPVTVDPDARRTRQLPLLAPVDRFHRTSELPALPRLHLHERHHTVPLGDQVDVPPTRSESPLEHPPPSVAQPALRHHLARHPEPLPLARHTTKLRAPGRAPSSFERVPHHSERRCEGAPARASRRQGLRSFHSLHARLASSRPLRPDAPHKSPSSPAMRSSSDNPTRISRGFEPFGGPSTPAWCSWSMMRAARP
jgi:hypothetical protein